MSVLTSLLTGLGLLFCGVRFIAANLTPLAGPAARRLFRKAVATNWGAAFAGVISGLATQNTSAVTLVVVGFVRAGILPEGRAVLLPVWSQVGAATLVVLVSLPTSAVVAYALAIAGTILYFDLKFSDRVRHGVLVLLGAGLLFLGMDMLTVDTDPLRVWLAGHGLLGRNESSVLLLALGLGLAIVTQSSTTAGAIAVALVRTGVIGLGGGLVLLIGASMGSALNYGIPGWKDEAVGRHVMLFQAAQKLSGATLVSIFMALTAGHPETLLVGVRMSPAIQFASAFLVTQVAGSLACTLLFEPLSRWLQKIAPPAPEESLGQPVYLLDEALADPMLALDLVEREEQGLLQRLPAMLDDVRADVETGAFAADTLRVAGLRICDATRRYLAGVLESEPGRQAVMRAMRLQHVLDNLAALHEAVAEFEKAVKTTQAKAGAAVGHMVESLHLLLEVLIDVAVSQDRSDQEMSLALLGDRRQVIEGLRARLMSASSDAKVQEALFRSTVLFERIVWLARDTAVTVMQSSETSAAAESVASEPLLAPGEASA